MKTVAAACGVLLLMLVGCAGTETRTYDVTVKNDSSKPLIVWLTKNGPEYEEGWKAPEDLAIENPKNDPLGFQLVPPGKTAYTGPIKGKFAPQTSAILRVYIGQHTFGELLAISRGSPSRIELTLEPGVNEFVAKDDLGIVKITRSK
jgi:hypothetical protein